VKENKTQIQRDQVRSNEKMDIARERERERESERVRERERERERERNL
jgi:hypothetical protein